MRQYGVRRVSNGDELPHPVLKTWTNAPDGLAMAFALVARWHNDMADRFEVITRELPDWEVVTDDEFED